MTLTNMLTDAERELDVYLKGSLAILVELNHLLAAQGMLKL